ncbi:MULTISPECIES: hypothetical protein [Photorhabdus]|uniref:Resolvase/invertase-type recombinase catalytic domain-containing protein n=2 Tax=Photorhabdus TaxID=29487 RepID=A0ABX0AW59_9GAMM|nr:MULTISPECIES: hypothetical protein [Photorhabdus]MCC8373502.1 hypothetical protein [Photorhabdus bodei]MCT8352556.1 hypothetical protein [Photorhabdus kayaii]MDB6367757.1 hypothetical protein [Photorhabdus bodei]MDB6372416.1 hypothetical protein [Photorhabdus bodei]NDL12086.1 hypothetical protein [Photorhabdus kayaii]
MTGVSECSQQRGNLKDNGYTILIAITRFSKIVNNNCLYFMAKMSSIL